MNNNNFDAHFLYYLYLVSVDKENHSHAVCSWRWRYSGFSSHENGNLKVIAVCERSFTLTSFTSLLKTPTRRIAEGKMFCKVNVTLKSCIFIIMKLVQKLRE